MEVRPVLKASGQLLAAIEARDADLKAAVGQLATWDRQGLRVPRVIVGVAGPPDPNRVEAELAAFRITGERLALAFPERWLDADGMRDSVAEVRARTGANAIVADFGSGLRPDVEFLVDYPADALALSARIVDRVAEDDGAAERVRETCAVAAELGWRVIAADVGSPEERSALAAAGVDEVAGPGVAGFDTPAGLSPLLSTLKVMIPAAPEASRRAPASPPRPSAPRTPAAQPVPARRRGEERSQATSPWSQEHGGPRDARERPRPPARASASGASALPSGARGSPGRSQPPRGGPAATRRRGSNLFVVLLALLVLAAIAYAVLAYLGHVPDPLGIEEISL